MSKSLLLLLFTVIAITLHVEAQPVSVPVSSPTKTESKQNPPTVNTKPKTTPTTKTPVKQQQSSAKGWSEEEHAAFLRTCIPATGFRQDSAENYCHCMLGKIEKLYPNAIDADKKLTKEKTMELARQCLMAQSTNVATQWTIGDRNKFLTECINSAQKNVGEQRAGEYCSCMLKKLERAYPNSADAQKIKQDEITKWAAECNKQ